MRIKQPEIIYEDEAIIVCRKEAGVAVQTARAGQADVVSLLKNYRAKKKEEPYIGLIHRLDQPVEGVCENAAGDSKTVCAGQQSQHGKRISGGDNRCAGATKRRTSGLAAAGWKNKYIRRCCQGNFAGKRGCAGL